MVLQIEACSVACTVENQLAVVVQRHAGLDDVVHVGQSHTPSDVPAIDTWTGGHAAPRPPQPLIEQAHERVGVVTCE